jgi:hypothetical protein
MAAKRVKGLAAKARDSYRFGSEPPSSPLFGKSRKDWDAAKAARAKRGKR